MSPLALLLLVAVAAPAKGKAAAPAPKVEAPAPAPAPVVEAAPVAPAPAPEPAGPPKLRALRVAVLDPAITDPSIPVRAVGVFTQSLVPEIRKLEGVSAIGMGEIRDMLAFDRTKKLLTCSEDTCLEEIGGSLGVDEIVSTQLSLAGSTYTLTMKRMNIKKGKVVETENRAFEQRDGEELLQILGPIVQGLFKGRPLKEGRVAGVNKEAIARLNPPPLPRVVFFATGAAAVIAGGVGGVFGYLSRDSQNNFKSLAEGSVAPGSSVSGAELNAKIAQAKSRANTANVLFAASGALALATVVEIFFTDWRDDRAAVQAQPQLLSGGSGAGVTFAGSF